MKLTLNLHPTFKTVLILLILVFFSSCKPSPPSKAKFLVFDKENKNIPSLKIEIDNQKVFASFSLAGNTLFDSIYYLEEQDFNELMTKVGKHGLKVYNDDIPEWKNTELQELSIDQWSSIEDLFYPIFPQGLDYYHTFLNAAQSLINSEPTKLEKRDTFAAD